MIRSAAVLTLLFLSSAAPVLADTPSVNVRTDGSYRYIESNGLPDHSTGRFPNQGNPNAIQGQSYRFRVPLDPGAPGAPKAYGHNLFGVALNGVPFDPGTAEYWNNDRQSGWNYEALSGKINLGIDQNHAHVQPGGAYHYHGVPDGFLDHHRGGAVTLVGYAADGFPIYYSRTVRSGYRLKSGVRPSGPGGAYDGTFVQDYEYAGGSGTLDACNGQSGPTPEYPSGIYHYFLTDTFPFIPRCHRGVADSSFNKARPHTGQNPERPAGGGPQRPAPPREAVRACEGHSASSSCSFQSPRGPVSGVCREIGEQLACVPSGPPGRPH